MTFKRIKKETILYHYFKFENKDGTKKYALFDVDMDMPISYGSRALVEGTIRNLPKHVTIVYYEIGPDNITFENSRFQKYVGKEKKA